MAAPRGSTSHPVWFKTALTGVFHADSECPAVADTMDPAHPQGVRVIYELDRTRGVAWLWRIDKMVSKEWVRAIDDVSWAQAGERVMSVDLTKWRPCLRCGSIHSDGSYRLSRRPAELAAVCPRCHLTICDCD